MQIEILKIYQIFYLQLTHLWLVVWFTSIYQIINITIKIDDLISKKLNNRQYIKTSLNSILIFFKNYLLLYKNLFNYQMILSLGQKDTYSSKEIWNLH